MHLSKFMECTKARGNPNVNYKIWVIATCQCNEYKFINYNKFFKRAIHLILKGGQYERSYWKIYTYGIHFSDGTMQWPTKDLVIANKEMLELYLSRTSVYFEPIAIIAVLFIARICRSGILRVEVRANPSAFYSFLSSLLKNNFCTINCALLYKKSRNQ